MDNIYNNFIGCDIAFVGPANLKTEYLSEFSKINYYSFNKRYFESIDGYNKLLKSLNFYRTFNNYNFILIAQTDAWIFGSSRDLTYFYQYDYSGAISYYNNEPHGFNGGLSLRNVQSSIEALKSWKNFEKPSEILRRHFPAGQLPKLHKFGAVVLDLLFRKRIHGRLNFFIKCNEDLFWSVLVPKAIPGYKVIAPEDAVKFSWEHNCENLIKAHDLPFGCHGWWNYNFDFWKDIIEIESKIKS